MAGQTISIGQYRQDFVYCKSARRPAAAACPVGDLLDAMMWTCVPTETKMDDLSPSSVPYSLTVSPREGVSQTTPTPSTSSPSSLYQTVVVKDPKNDDWQLRLRQSRWQRRCILPLRGAVMDWPLLPPTTLSPIHVHFECARDGGFSIDCKGGFVACSNGDPSLMKCPHALTFDEYSQACQYPDHVGSCGMAPIGSLDVAPYTRSIPSTTAAPLTAVEVLVKTLVDKGATSLFCSHLLPSSPSESAAGRGGDR